MSKRRLLWKIKTVQTVNTLYYITLNVQDHCAIGHCKKRFIDDKACLYWEEAENN